MTTQSNTPTTTSKEPKAPDLAPTGHTRIMALAKYLGIHHQTLRGWVRDDKIPQPKVINGIKLFDNAEVLAWLKKQRATTDQAKGA